MKEQQKLTRSDLRGVNKEVIDVVMKAMTYGWSGKKRSSGGWALVCRCGEHHAYVPLGTNTSHVAKQMLANIEKCPRNLGTPSSEVAIKGLARRSQEPEKVLTAPISELVGDDVLVSERPHMSKKGEKQGKTVAYASPVVIEQVWSDGQVSFRCKFCEWGGRGQTNPRSVANHAGNAHKEDGRRVSQEDLVVIDEVRPTAFTKNPYTRSYTPSERLVKALTEFLEQAGTNDPAGLAYAALNWMHERPDLGDPELRVRSSEPKTPEELVAAIRTLVDGGRYEVLEAKIVTLQTALKVAEEERTAAADRAAKLLSRLERVTEELMEGL